MTTGKKKFLVGICVVLLIFVIVAIVGVAYFGSKMENSMLQNWMLMPLVSQMNCHMMNLDI